MFDYGIGTPYSSSFPSGKQSSFRCYESHPPLKIGPHQIYGGSCSMPIILDADIYVGFDHSMRAMETFPWQERTSFLYPITDHSVPKDVASFHLLIEYLKQEMEAGAKVHLGCIGGHGRTGMVLSALVKEMLGEEDATQYVRTHYCKRAVESSSQIEFLQKHFGIKPVAPSSTRGLGSSKVYKGGKGMEGYVDAEKHLPPLRNSKLNLWSRGS